MPMPEEGSSFTGWSGDCVGSGACVVTMDAARSVTATFMLSQYALTVSRSGGGGGTVTSSPPGIDCGTDCSESYTYGTWVTLTPVAAPGSTFSGWSGACAGRGACVVTVDGVRSVTARFTREDHGGTDFNGDGQGDILWHHQTTGELYVWFLDGTVTVDGDHLTPPAFADVNWQIRGVADFDANGQVDILWHHKLTGDLYVWFLDGTVVVHGDFLTPSRFADARWQIRGVADFDGNGSPDILWHHQVSGELYVWFLDGTVTTTGAFLTPSAFADTRWQIRGIADFNGDGKVDVLWHEQTTGDLYVWFLDGTVTTTGAFLTPSRLADTRWQIRRVADFDKDGKVDVLWHNQVNGELFVWVLDGTVTTTGVHLTPSHFTDTRWQIMPR